MVKWFESGIVKVILSKDLNDIYIMRIDILDKLKVIDKLYDDSHVLLYLFHPLMIMMISSGYVTLSYILHISYKYLW